MNLQELRQQRQINPLVALVIKARSAMTLNTQDNENRFCDCCFGSIPLASESFKIANGLDCCIACKAACDCCNSPNEQQEEAERIFRRSVLYSIEQKSDWKVKWTSCTDCWERRCCGTCLTLVESATPILMNYPMRVCDDCILQIRREAATDFTNMKPFMLREYTIGQKEQCECQKKNVFNLFD